MLRGPGFFPLGTNFFFVWTEPQTLWENNKFDSLLWKRLQRVSQGLLVWVVGGLWTRPIKLRPCCISAMWTEKMLPQETWSLCAISLWCYLCIVSMGLRAVDVPQRFTFQLRRSRLELEQMGERKRAPSLGMDRHCGMLEDNGRALCHVSDISANYAFSQDGLQARLQKHKPEPPSVNRNDRYRFTANKIRAMAEAPFDFTTAAKESVHWMKYTPPPWLNLLSEEAQPRFFAAFAKGPHAASWVSSRISKKLRSETRIHFSFSCWTFQVRVCSLHPFEAARRIAEVSITLMWMLHKGSSYAPVSSRNANWETGTWWQL